MFSAAAYADAEFQSPSTLASAQGRKGAWELRELGLPLKLAGPVLEAADFWKDAEVESVDFCLDGVAAVVLPAWVENQPRRLLQAVGAGIPVVATAACGLDGVAGVTVVANGDVETLRGQLESAAGLKTCEVDS